MQFLKNSKKYTEVEKKKIVFEMRKKLSMGHLAVCPEKFIIFNLKDI